MFLIFVVLSFLNQAFVRARQSSSTARAGALENGDLFRGAGPARAGRCAGGLQPWMAGGCSPPPSPGCWRSSIWPAPPRGCKLQAGLIRLEAGDRPQILGPTLRAFLFGIVAVVGIQFLFVGSAYPWLIAAPLPTSPGALLIGLAPLMLAYLIVAALASLLASSPEKTECNFNMLNHW